MGLVILGKDSSIGVTVVTTDDHDSRNFQFTQNLQTCFKLLGLLKFCST